MCMCQAGGFLDVPACTAAGCYALESTLDSAAGSYSKEACVFKFMEILKQLA